MKISGRKNIKQVSPLGGPAETPKPDKATEPTAAAKSNSDNFNLSDASKNLMKLKETVDVMPEVRTERVTEIKTALDDGQYHVQSEKIARKIVDESLSESLHRKT
jgi:flagellar biosynthesis anti-sigma factor FlgM